MTDFVYAKNVLMMAQKTDGQYHPFACVEEFALNTDAGIVETSVKGGGNWQTNTYNRKLSWQCNLRGILLLTDLEGAWTAEQIQDAQWSFQVLNVQFVILSETGKVMYYYGSVLLPKIEFSATTGEGGEFARWNYSFTGTGMLTKYPAMDKEAYLLYEDGGKQLLEDNSGGAILME